MDTAGDGVLFFADLFFVLLLSNSMFITKENWVIYMLTTEMLFAIKVPINSKFLINARSHF